MTNANKKHDLERIVGALIYLQNEADAAGLRGLNRLLKRLIRKVANNASPQAPAGDKEGEIAARFLLRFVTSSDEGQQGFLAAAGGHDLSDIATCACGLLLSACEMNLGMGERPHCRPLALSC